MKHLLARLRAALTIPRGEDLWPDLVDLSALDVRDGIASPSRQLVQGMKLYGFFEEADRMAPLVRVAMTLPEPPGSTLTPEEAEEAEEADARHAELAWPLREDVRLDPDLYDQVLDEALAPGSIADEITDYLKDGAR